MSHASRILRASRKTLWRDIAAIVQSHYLNWGAKITLENSGQSLPVDTAEVESVLNMKWRPLESTVTDVTG
ncbi:hypothetical protein Asppvi_005942 [Aspergillus pseudoviridinutans]|uniref:Uncharacterized protein n=1 Tax=Aspergillus pseudoviridinutans TaxID=1517512 RepID=A0A9P3EVQ9_9EURO|nr:uncharacterized protein Asppvi_005942 [Aspergillus pseudoviridinutans]GIJ87040.1 hypothetical protein Asppvi_005942 [Aspergillus pseudoviridinutans]